MNPVIQNIGLYMPLWLYESSFGDKQFLDQCCDTLSKSDSYNPVRLYLDSQEFRSLRDLSAFLKKQNIYIIVNHDSHYFQHFKITYPFYKKTMQWLEKLHDQGKIVLVNSPKALLQAHDKNRTKNILREENIPVLDDTEIWSSKDCEYALKEYKVVVMKPLNSGAWDGIKLLRYHYGFEEYKHSLWLPVKVFSFGKFLYIQEIKDFRVMMLLYVTYSIFILCIIFIPGIPFWKSFFIGALLFYVFSRFYNHGYTYKCPCMLEPYFNDDPVGFSSLRCTVIGNKVIETIKRTNVWDMTSNVSRGGVATPTHFTKEQRNIAVRASRAIWADYAGVDLLTCWGKTVIGEVNVWPITIFGDVTNIAVGEIFAEYLMKRFSNSLT